MPTVQKIRIFLASPGDVSEERDIVGHVVQDINRTLGNAQGFVIEVVRWETHARPSYGSDGQNIINTQIADMSQYDLFVGIMWNRFGQATPRAGSGTEEEFNRAVDSFEKTGGPEIMIYFRQTPSLFKTPEDLEQKANVLQFRRRVQDNGLTRDYETPQEFRNLFHNHLSMWLLGRTTSPPSPPPPLTHVPAPAVAPTQGHGVTVPISSPYALPSVARINDSGSWLLLDGRFYMADLLSETSDGSIEVRITPRATEDDVALRDLRSNSQNRHAPLSYAFQNDARIVSVKTSMRETVDGSSVWTMVLQPEQSFSGSYTTEMGHINFSASQIAELRARLLLLNETPQLANKDNINDIMVMTSIHGVSAPVKVTSGIFPELWRQFQGQQDLFLPLARLSAVFFLMASNVCEHVLELALGPVENDEVEVNFRGQRHKSFSNRTPPIIEIRGKCPLASK